MSYVTVVIAAVIIQAQPPGTVDEWLALGAFPMIEGDTRLIHDYLSGEGGEAAIEPDIGSAGQGLTWSPVRPDSVGFLRFARILMSGRRGNSFTYAHTYLWLPRAGGYRMTIESANDVVAYINGWPALTREADVPQKLRTDSIEVRLASGWNRLIVKLGNRTGPYLLRVRVTEASGHAVEEMHSSGARPLGLPLSFLNPEVDAHVFEASGGWVVDSTGVLWQPVYASADSDAEGAASQVTLGGLTFAPRDDGDDRLVFWLPVEEMAALAARDGSVEARMGSRALRWSASDILMRLARPIALASSTAVARLPAGGLLAGFELSFEPESQPTQLRITNPGYPDVRESMRWAAHFTGDTSIYKWTEEDDRDLLQRLLRRDRSAYFGRVAEIERAASRATRQLKADSLWLLGHAHIDAAWLWPRSETESVARNTLASALAIGRKYPEFRFVQNSPVYLQWIERNDPALFAEIQKAVAEGRWTLAGGGWLEADLNMSSGESLVRHQLLTQRYFETRFGRRARLGWLLDVFGHAGSFPQILLDAGYERFVAHKIRWSDRNRFPYTAFWWEGVDGSRIPTYVAYLYDHNMNGEWLARDYLEHKETTGAADQMILFGVSDHGGGPTLEMMERAKELERVGPFPALAHSLPEPTLDKVFGGIEPEQLPTWRGELYVETHRGVYTSQAKVKRWNRRLEAALETSEKLASLAWLEGLEYPAAELDSAWRVLLFNQFHDILAGSSIDAVYQDAARDFAAADSLNGWIVERSFDRLAGGMDTRGTGEPVVVFNPLGWSRTGRTAVALERGLEGTALEVRDAGGRLLPSAAIADSIVFLADSVPALGFKVFWVVESGSREVSVGQPADYTLENQFLVAKINPLTGNLASLVDKRLGRELITEEREANRLVVLRDSVAFWEAWNLGWTGETWEVDSVLDVTPVVDGGLRQGVRVRRAWGDSQFECTYWLYSGSAVLVIENDFDWRESRKMLKAAFPLATLGDTVWAEIPYAAIGRPTVPVTPFDSAKFEAPMQRWLDVGDGEAGVTLTNDSHYGYDIKDGEVRLSLLRGPRWPDPNSDRGRHRFTYALSAHAGDWREGEAWRQGAELNVPLVARWEPEHPGRRGSEYSWFDVDGSPVVVGALKKAEREDALVVRLVEPSGRPAEIGLGSLAGLTSARSANILEDPTGKLPITSGTLRLRLRPYQIRTVLLLVAGPAQ